MASSTFFFILSLSLLHFTLSSADNHRISLEIIIGGVNDDGYNGDPSPSTPPDDPLTCPPPLPPPPPPPPSCLPPLPPPPPSCPPPLPPPPPPSCPPPLPPPPPPPPPPSCPPPLPPPPPTCSPPLPPSPPPCPPPLPPPHPPCPPPSSPPPPPPPSPPPPLPSPPPPSPSPPPPSPSPPPPSPSPPPPSPSPPPPKLRQGDFSSPYIKKVFPIVKNFQKLIDIDPKNILKSWRGYDICAVNKYIGLECAILPGQKYQALVSIQFNEFNFAGEKLRLDNFLDKLDEVSIFHANSNNFLGSIPKVSHLQYLFELDLSNNKLTGDFPDNVLEATNLTFLDLRFNNLKGSVPPQVFNLDLDVLFINNNNLVQTLPSNLGSITALYLSFANNRLTGPIPNSIGDIKYLQEVLFLNNQLTGCLPYQIGKLNQVITFDVKVNRLTGPIPYSFGCLDNIQQLNLARNNFYGTIPEIVCELSSLKNLSLSYNYFTQVGPKCRKLIKNKVLDVRMNCILDLPNQKTPWECAKFFMKKQSCPDSKSLFLVPCGKNPNRIKPDHLKEDQVVSTPVSYRALNPGQIRNL